MTEPKPSEDLMQRAELVAARSRLGWYVGERVRQLADELLNAGIFDECILAVHDGEVDAEAREAFFGCLGIPQFTTEQAAWRLLHHHISAIASGTSDPWQGMRNVIDDVWDAADVLDSSKAVAGDAYGIERLYGAYHDDYVAKAKLTKILIAESKVWLSKHTELGPR